MTGTLLSAADLSLSRLLCRRENNFQFLFVAEFHGDREWRSQSEGGIRRE